MASILLNIAMMFVCFFKQVGTLGQGYNHPNGRDSLLKFPGVLCGDGHHATLLAPWQPERGVGCRNTRAMVQTGPRVFFFLGYIGNEIRSYVGL